jgi:pyruvate/2-oxoglutarate dehydrogenase complex dihydrolipoamide dehydrogenase (E3) component
MTLLVAFGILIIFALSIYAIKLWMQVYERNKRSKEQERAFIEQQEKQLQHIHESLNVIAKSMTEKQCPLIEGCIRIKVLLDQLQLPQTMQQEFAIFEKIYSKTNHIPTHQAWKDLKLKNRHQFTSEMEQLTTKHEQEILAGAEQLVSQFTVTPTQTH